MTTHPSPAGMLTRRSLHQLFFSGQNASPSGQASFASSSKTRQYRFSSRPREGSKSSSWQNAYALSPRTFFRDSIACWTASSSSSMGGLASLGSSSSSASSSSSPSASSPSMPSPSSPSSPSSG